MNQERSMTTSLELYLQQNPQKAREVALKLATEAQLLELQVQTLIADNHKLTSQLIQMYEKIPSPKPKPVSATLPSFLKCSRH